MTHNLSKDEIEFFYNILYKYELESLAGFQDKEVEKLMGSKVALDDKHKDGENITTEKKDCLHYSDGRKRKTCNMLGIISKKDFYELIDAMENTRKVARKKTSKP